MTKNNDLTGLRFNRFLVVKKSDQKKDRHSLWECLCDCGNIRLLKAATLKKQNTISCGCFKKEAEDLSNKKFGKLTVSSRALDLVSKNGDTHVAWNCLCDCGKSCTVRAANLKNGKTQSCATGKCKARLTLKERFSRKILDIYKRGAISRGFDFSIDEEKFVELTNLPCNYCGREKVNSTQLEFDSGNEFYLHNGVDRVDSAVGYTQDNCVSCCRDCNLMKNDYSIDEFLEHIERIQRFRTDKDK